MTDSSPEEIAGAHFNQLRRTSEFTVTEQHLKLLKRAYVTWEYVEFGGPAINGKRPYGNSDVLRDIAEIIGEGPMMVGNWGDAEDEEREQWLEDNAERLAKIHGEVGIVLQIVLATGHAEPGDYVKTEKYDATSWVPKP